MKRSALALAALLLTLMIVIASGAFAEDPHAERPTGGRVQVATATERPTETSGVDAYERAQGYVEVVTYLAAVAENDRALAAIGTARDDVGAYLVATIPPPPPPPVQPTYAPSSPSPSPSTVSGDGSCYGGPIPDYIVTRESGGNPMAENPSGAFGCYQIMPEWWSGACSAFDKYSVDGQKQCAAILWDGGAGASNWAATG